MLGPAIVTIIERWLPQTVTTVPDKFHCITKISACHVNIHSPVYCVLTILVSIFMKQLVKTHNYLHQFVFSIINRTLHIVSIRLCYFAMGPQQAFLKVLCILHTIRIWYVHTFPSTLWDHHSLSYFLLGNKCDWKVLHQKQTNCHALFKLDFSGILTSCRTYHNLFIHVHVATINSKCIINSTNLTNG